MSRVKPLLLFVPIMFVTFSYAAPFRVDSLYSKWIIDSRMGDFRNKAKTERFLTPYNSASTATWDYVPGLVGKAILKAWEQYRMNRGAVIILRNAALRRQYHYETRRKQY